MIKNNMIDYWYLHLNAAYDEADKIIKDLHYAAKWKNSSFLNKILSMVLFYGWKNQINYSQKDVLINKLLVYIEISRIDFEMIKKLEKGGKKDNEDF